MKKYPGAVFKGFHDRSDADSFVSGSSSSGGKRGGNVYPMSSSGGGGKISGGGSYGGKDSGRGGGGGSSSYISRARERYSGNFTSRKNRWVYSLTIIYGYSMKFFTSFMLLIHVNGLVVHYTVVCRTSAPCTEV